MGKVLYRKLGQNLIFCTLGGNRMNILWRERLSKLEKNIEAKTGESKENWRNDRATKKMVAKSIVGFPYYWGEYSGTVVPCEKDEACVTVHIVEQQTGAVCFWVFDSLYVYEQLLKIKDFEDWSAYDRTNKIKFAKEFEELLGKLGYGANAIAEKMDEYCQKFKIPFKDYYVCA